MKPIARIEFTIDTTTTQADRLVSALSIEVTSHQKQLNDWVAQGRSVCKGSLHEREEFQVVKRWCDEAVILLKQALRGGLPDFGATEALQFVANSRRKATLERLKRARRNKVAPKASKRRKSRRSDFYTGVV